MLIAAQRLDQEELDRLGLDRDPFRSDVRCHADVFLPPPHRRVREEMWQTAQHRGLLVVVGESGSGKTVLRRDFMARAATEDASVVPILPYTLGMEASEKRGQSLRAADIAEMIVRRLAPTETLRASRQGRYAQAETLLAQRVAAGQKPVLVIEEAHRMNKATLRHLKGFAEMEMGYAGMLGIILIGQTELADVLSETDPTIREVVQRFQVMRLPPLDDVAGYLRHKFARSGADLDAIADADALTAIQERLGGARSRRGTTSGQVVSLCYPLAAQNLLVISLRSALQIGRFERLTRDHVEAV
jgi:type II secretory pathway predicted ATPase ExeA